MTETQEFGLKITPLVKELYTTLKEITFYLGDNNTKLNDIFNGIVNTMFELPNYLTDDTNIGKIKYFLATNVSGWIVDLENMDFLIGIDIDRCYLSDLSEIVIKAVCIFEKLYDMLENDMTLDREYLQDIRDYYGKELKEM